VSLGKPHTAIGSEGPQPGPASLCARILDLDQSVIAGAIWLLARNYNFLHIFVRLFRAQALV
jgi:hypothetical protein